ncbi:hypothetical protein QQZ08_006465 [Neonectria magnoliae]|uniref:Formyl-CoA transferase n=1 Tax=Neonectria magnoliae TaxID=2732573 RepID=A0ABR1I292_9HYPO
MLPLDYPYGPFATSGGGSVMLGVQNEREWANLCAKVLGNADLAQDERFVNNTLRVKNRNALKAIILEAFADKKAEEVLARLDKTGIANAKVNDMQGVWDHHRLRVRGRWTEIDTPAGKVPALLLPGVKGTDAVRMDAVPALGQHNEAIFAELGFPSVDGLVQKEE